jgi:hypothetical protein
MNAWNFLLAVKKRTPQLNRNLNLQRYKVLYISGNYFSILSKLDRRFQDQEIRRAFIAFQLMTILEEARHNLIVIEHDPQIYEDASGMIDLASESMCDAAKEAAVLLYSPGTDTFLEDLTRNADRVFYFDEGPRAEPKLISKAYPRAQKSQTTLGANHCCDFLSPVGVNRSSCHLGEINVVL